MRDENSIHGWWSVPDSDSSPRFRAPWPFRADAQRDITPRAIRVLLLYNQDFGPGVSSPKRGEEARAGVLQTARAVELSLWGMPGVEVVRKPIDTPTTLRRLLAEDRRYDLAFNLCESLRGDPRFEIPVPVLLEAHGIPYTGNPPFALRRCLDKLSAREALAAEGVPIPAGCGVRREEDLFRLEGPLPAIVKPVREDGSIGIEAGSVVRDRLSLRRRARYVLEKLAQPALVEAYVEGREFNVSVLGDLDPACLPVAEIDFSLMPLDVPKIVSYNAKWRVRSAEFKGTVPTFGVLDEALARRIRRAALGAFRALGLRDYARVDMRVNDAGQPFVIDVNPNCDLAPDAGFPKAAAAAGMSYPALVHAIVALALERGRRHAPAPALPV